MDAEQPDLRADPDPFDRLEFGPGRTEVAGIRRISERAEPAGLHRHLQADAIGRERLRRRCFVVHAEHELEAIGIALDLPGNRMFVTDFGGSIYRADLDGSNLRTLAGAQGNLAGIAYADI